MGELGIWGGYKIKLRTRLYYVRMPNILKDLIIYIFKGEAFIKKVMSDDCNVFILKLSNYQIIKIDILNPHQFHFLFKNFG